MNYLIVGANSFLACCIAKILHTQGESIFGLINESDDKVVYSHYKQIFKKKESLEDKRIDFDVIFIVGAYIPPKGQIGPIKKYTENNIELILIISDLYPKARIVFCSSISVYGKPISDVIDEYSAYNNPNLYGMSKLAGETIILNHKSFAIIRFSSIWGVNMKRDTFLPTIIDQAKTGKINLWGKGDRIQNYIHVTDAARMCILAAHEHKNFTALGVFPKSYSNLYIARIVAKRLNAKICFENEDRMPSYKFNALESYNIFNFVPQVNIGKIVDELS